MTAPLFPLLPINRTASGAIEPYRLVKPTAVDGVYAQSSSATDKHLGVSGSVRADNGERIGVEHGGVVPVRYGEDGITPGTPLTSNASGKAVAAVPGNFVIGFAMETGDMDIIGSVLIQPHLHA